MAPKAAQQTGHNLSMSETAGPTTKHTFERIQFKQATANNGKRRTPQQYYHLLVELHINVRTQNNPHWIKVAQRKSTKIIMRGRSKGAAQAVGQGVLSILSAASVDKVRRAEASSTILALSQSKPDAVGFSS